MWECLPVTGGDLSSHSRPEALSERVDLWNQQAPRSIFIYLFIFLHFLNIFIYLFWIYQALAVGMKDLLVAMPTLSCDK